MPDDKASLDTPNSPFAVLLKEIGACPPAESKKHFGEWRKRVDTIWPSKTSNEGYWELLVDQLPVASNSPEDVEPKSFASLLSAVPDECRSLDRFICACAYDRLTQFSWTSHESPRALRFLAGCVNLATIALKCGLADSSQDLMVTLETGISAHWRVLVRLATCLPKLFEKTAAGYRFCNVLGLQPVRNGVDPALLTPILQDRVELLDQHVFDIITFFTGLDQRQILQKLVPALITNRESRRAARIFFLEDANISRAFLDAVARSTLDADRAELLRTWTHYLVSEDAFELCWWVLCWTPRNDQFGKSFDDRFLALRSLLLEVPPGQMFHDGMRCDWKESLQWRTWYVRLFGAICGLVGTDRWARVDEEAWVRQSEAAELLIQNQAQLQAVVHGILAKGRSHWDVLDPIILGLPTQPALECLQQYLDAHTQPLDDYFHAKRLMAHLRGEMTVTDPHRGASGLLGAVEHLIITSQTKMPGQRHRTWLGDSGVESLWYGAMETAVRDFTDYLASQYGQDEHEHAAVLADGLARHLNRTNAIVTEWLRKKQSVPLFVRASVRRLPKTAPGDFPQEGGSQGLQADLAMLITCDVPNVMKAQRLTLIQAKKLRRVEGPECWGTGFHFKGKEFTQLERLIQLSQEAHYLFFISPELGCPSLILPALTVKGSCSSSNAQAVPLSVVRNGGVSIADFLLHGVIGLWSGDDNDALIAKCQKGCDIGQGPRVVLEVRVTSEAQGQQ